MNQELIQYVQQQLRTTDQRLKRFTHSPAGARYPGRFMFVKVKKYAEEFLHKKTQNSLLLIPGFRGVGKTTLLAQLCQEYKKQEYPVLFLSVEDAYNLFNAGILELLQAYEYILGNDLASVQTPVMVFLDEVQSDPKWAVTLKSLYETTSQVFFACTGSSSVVLQTNTDLARRAVVERLPPLCFTEYQMIRHDRYPTNGLKDRIRKAIYFCTTSREVYQHLEGIKSEVAQYWSKVPRSEIRAFLSYGTLPFAFTMMNETAMYDSISLLLDKIIRQDLPNLGRFDSDTLSVVKRLLFAIAENDTTSLNLLEERFRINRLTIASLFEALQKTELLIDIPAYGSNMSVAKKPHKYLFMSPAIRMSFFYFTGQESTYITRMGKLLEDSIGGHIYREFILRDQGAVRYDSAQGGADFIVQILNRKQLIIEAGMGKKDKKQIVTTQKRIGSDYNLIFSDSPLQLDHDLNTVFVPLDYYFLM